MRVFFVRRHRAPAITTDRGEPVRIGHVTFAHQIHRASEQLGEFGPQTRRVEEAPVGGRFIFDQKVDVAVRSGVVAGLRTEEAEFADLPAATKRLQLLGWRRVGRGHPSSYHGGCLPPNLARPCTPAGQDALGFGPTAGRLPLHLAQHRLARHRQFGERRA
jgi:hypothetical protein